MLRRFGNIALHFGNILAETILRFASSPPAAAAKQRPSRQPVESNRPPSEVELWAWVAPTLQIHRPFPPSAKSSSRFDWPRACRG
jgi:hypothetical protein